MTENTAAVRTSARVAAAHDDALGRRARQRAQLRPFGWAVIIVVVAASTSASPAPGVRGAHLGVLVVLAVFVAAMSLVASPRWAQLGTAQQLAAVTAMGGCAVALAGLQPTGAAAFAASTAIWVACARFYVRLAIAVAITITAALCVVDVTVAHVSTASVLATALLCALLALMARFMRTAWDNQDRTELLLAELQDARDSQAAAAAAAERARIAGDLHDVLAHSLSGVAIQLQVARKMADTQATSQQLRETIATASRLTRDSLGDARRAVDALRGEEQPTLDQLDALVTAYRRDARLDVTVTVDGDRRRLAPAAELALYRGVEEALTNVARHAPGTMATVTVTYRPDCATVVIADTGPGPGSEHADLHGVGGGHGLSGMRERISAAGGTMSAGPGDGGWTVMLQVPS